MNFNIFMINKNPKIIPNTTASLFHLFTGHPFCIEQIIGGTLQ